MARRQPEEHLELLQAHQTPDLLSGDSPRPSLGGSNKNRRSKAGRSILDTIVAGGESADEILDGTPADILSDGIRCLLRNNVAILFSASRDDGSLLVTLYANGEKRYITPRTADELVSRLEALLLSAD